MIVCDLWFGRVAILFEISEWENWKMLIRFLCLGCLCYSILKLWRVSSLRLPFVPHRFVYMKGLERCSMWPIDVLSKNGYGFIQFSVNFFFFFCFVGFIACKDLSYGETASRFNTTCWGWWKLPICRSFALKVSIVSVIIYLPCSCGMICVLRVVL